MKWAEYMGCIAIIFMPIVFYGIDFRTKTIIHRCEELMKHMETRYKPFQFGADPIHCIDENCKGWSQISCFNG